MDGRPKGGKRRRRRRRRKDLFFPILFNCCSLYSLCFSLHWPDDEANLFHVFISTVSALLRLSHQNEGSSAYIHIHNQPYFRIRLIDDPRTVQQTTERSINHFNTGDSIIRFSIDIWALNKMLNEKEKERKKKRVFLHFFFSIDFFNSVQRVCIVWIEWNTPTAPSTLDCQFARMKYEPTLISPTDKALFFPSFSSSFSSFLLVVVLYGRLPVLCWNK